MFMISNKKFKFGYFVSAIFPINIILMISIVFNFPWSKLNLLKSDWCILKLLVIVDITLVLILLVFTILGIAFGIYIKNILNNIPKSKESMNIYKVKFFKSYNSGYDDFILSSILPILSTFTLNDKTLYSLIMIILFEILIYFFFLKSSDFFPNILLALLGYSVVKGEVVEKKISGYSDVETEQPGNKVYIFVKNKYVSNVLYQSADAIHFESGLYLY
ncbi:hypothetical protein ACWCL1_08030 [Ligilactobacillus sp. LYQ135]